MNTLFIDTTSNQEITVSVTKNGKMEQITQQLNNHKSQIVLPLIEKLLKKQQLHLKDLNAISVNPGPGSFTGVRVGVSVANALSFALQIPVNG
ncbi:MAG TPA: tRNA (adenosine(37)-N6)-threonylcarbamoyltransferase complex dimerization subunit type 1 TsaB, partial [Patescibacteria group bacterium]